jgi:hypothetical protein
MSGPQPGWDFIEWLKAHPEVRGQAVYDALSEWLGPWTADDERAWRFFAWIYPLSFYKINGIEHGKQYHILGKLAARYIRRFGVEELANDLWEVIEASDNRPSPGTRPWTYNDMTRIAARVELSFERKDAQALATYAAWQARKGGSR